MTIFMQVVWLTIDLILKQGCANFNRSRTLTALGPQEFKPESFSP